MKTFYAALIGVAALATVASSSVTPAFALGGCGFNGHRNFHGRCVFGGQNEDFCLRRTGHRATYVGGGRYRCF